MRFGRLKRTLAGRKSRTKEVYCGLSFLGKEINYCIFRGIANFTIREPALESGDIGLTLLAEAAFKGVVVFY
jgi:hypothetical protein